jgi:mannosyltransferase OCH1-like enzyme
VPSIPKLLSHVWIGPYKPPHDWMQTWIKHNPDWEYKLYDNSFLATFPFRTRRQIDEYLARGEYAGAADLMRYEILYNYGGFIAEADSVCYRSINPLFNKSCAYTVYENEFTRGNLVSPIFACEPGNPFVGLIIDELSVLDPAQLDTPWISTGNYYCAKMIRTHRPDIVIFPSHYFIPVHFTGEIYNGTDTVFAKQLFGTTRFAYGKLGLVNRIKRKLHQRYRRKMWQSEARKQAVIFEKDW